MNPLIGITSDVVENSLHGRPWNSSALLTSYADAVVAAGGLPVILPLARPDSSRELLDRLDGLILSGGVNDIPAEVFGEEPHPTTKPMALARWESERAWLDATLATNTPLLGICLGMQVMNVAVGGGLIQHIPDQCPGAGVHDDPSRIGRHTVEIIEKTKLAALAPARTVTVTSSHHQAIRDVPPPYRLAAVSPDGIVEAIEDPARDFLIGVQWHPEREPTTPNWLLRAFVAHCRGEARQRARPHRVY